MIDSKELESWLVLKNAEYHANEVPPIQRPFKAWSDLAREFKCSIFLSDPISEAIFDWFYKNTKPGSHSLGALFTGAFYFDTCFWPLSIPMAYGKGSFNALKCLDTMPSTVKNSLSESRQDLWELVVYWRDCIDYAFGIDKLINENQLDKKAHNFLRNGHRELIGAITQLLWSRPNTKAILSLRMSCEIFLKVLLIQEKKLNDNQLRQRPFGHNIKSIADECLNISGMQEFDTVAKCAKKFPKVDERYEGDEYKLSEIWDALCLTQIAAAGVTRYYTGRFIRS